MNAGFVKQITGPGTSSERFDFRATDLGYCALSPDGSRLMTIYGDTFRGARVGSGEWLSPVLCYSDKNAFRGGIVHNAAFGGQRAAQLLPYQHNVGGIATVLPSGLITFGGKSYLFATVSSGYPAVRSVEIQVCDGGDGSKWRHSGVEWPGNFLGGYFQMFAPVDWGDGFIYIFSSGFQRNKGMILHRVPKDRFLDKNAWVPWGYTQANGWRWGQPASVIFNDRIGEMTAEKIGNDLVLCYFNDSKYRVEVAVMLSPTDNLITCPKHTVVAGAGWPGEPNPERWDAGTMAQVYGGHIVPGSTHEELHVLVSQWRNQNRPATDGWPYLTNQFKMRIPNRNPLPPPSSTQTPVTEIPKENVMADAASVMGVLVNNDKVTLHLGNPGQNGGKGYESGDVREIIKAVGFESTLWVDSPEYAAIDWKTKQTVLGQAARAAATAKAALEQAQANGRMLSAILDRLTAIENGLRK